jgi:Zn-dependent protease
MSNKKRQLTYWATIGLVLLTFGKNILLVLKSAKFLTPFLSMLVSIWAYAQFAPLEFAVGLVILLLIHELGHVLAAKWRGLPVSAPLFIPFLGALITMKRHPRDAETEAFIALGGPVIGTLGALAFLWCGLLLGSPILIQLSFLGLLLNLVNLIPIHPLDGGRISVAVSRWLWLVGLIGGLYLIVFVLKSILFFVIWALFAWNLFSEYILKKKKQLEVTYSAQFRTAFDPVFMPDWFVPGEDHRRDLLWRTYSSLDGTQWVEFDWEGISLHEKIELPSALLVQRTHVTGIRHLRENGQLIALEIEVSVHGHQWTNDRYFEVTPLTRWIYGVSYAGLAGLIIGVMFWIAELIG